MNILDIIEQLLPDGGEAFESVVEISPAHTNIQIDKCPSWPPDVFAVVGSIIERSGCYTFASPDRKNIPAHLIYLQSVENLARAWNADILAPPQDVSNLWKELVSTHGNCRIAEICDHIDVVRCLLKIFAIADETCAGMGWDIAGDEAPSRVFAALTLLSLPDEASSKSFMQHLPTSLCVMVPPDRAIVLPKSITSSVGCTIRSLSHYLALLPPATIITPSWVLSSKQRSVVDRPDSSKPYDIRLLLVPFPFTIHAESFQLSTKRTSLPSGNHVPAYFKLEQRWLKSAGKKLTGEQLAKDLFRPLIRIALEESGWIPDGIVLPECALSSELARDLVKALANSGIEFLITGVLDTDVATGKTFNRAQTFIIRQGEQGAVVREQNKHHRWRLDRRQTDRYALDFDPDQQNDKWWEDIDVGQRKLPFFGLRKDMSLTTLICEDLARTDPAMTAIRAVGPNLVVALLMDGPQLAGRWPGRYATVLAEDPGSAVLSFTCAAMVDRSNWLEAKPARSIGLWRDAGGTTQEIGLPQGGLGVLLTLQSAKKHQNTLDNRSDRSLSRQLTLRTVVPLFLAKRPNWL